MCIHINVYYLKVLVSFLWEHVREYFKKEYKLYSEYFIMEWIKKTWKFFQEDSWLSLVATLVLAFFLIKFIFFPTLSFITGTSLPLVIVESCSMHHDNSGFDSVFSGSNVYRKNNISIGDTKDWDFQNGFNKGDVIFVVGAKNIKVGNVIIFNPSGSKNRYPVIHRVVGLEPIRTKGDNNAEQLTPSNNFNNIDETNIQKNQVIGKALFKVPFIGWAKLIFFEAGRKPQDRGFCK